MFVISTNSTKYSINNQAEKDTILHPFQPDNLTAEEGT